MGRIDHFENAQPEPEILPLADIGHIDLAEFFGVVDGGQAADVTGLEQITIGDGLFDVVGVDEIARFVDAVIGREGKGDVALRFIGPSR
ncbi:MAG TPA: hypothetical protein VNS12_12785 [Pelagibacterium sp.]|uniref:hypothetical protein n=1 Tax=Pelagibacterium sp. TaxID=1967288 RepID=UPI002C861944|nr:hypothetical protein [Pelagibacterium sp.]HWJ88938.1 hypothetical protein [Pelagibacterium sp.]